MSSSAGSSCTDAEEDAEDVENDVAGPALSSNENPRSAGQPSARHHLEGLRPPRAFPSIALRGAGECAPGPRTPVLPLSRGPCETNFGPGGCAARPGSPLLASLLSELCECALCSSTRPRSSYSPPWNARRGAAGRELRRGIPNLALLLAARNRQRGVERRVAQADASIPPIYPPPWEDAERAASSSGSVLLAPTAARSRDPRGSGEYALETGARCALNAEPSSFALSRSASKARRGAPGASSESASKEHRGEARDATKGGGGGGGGGPSSRSLAPRAWLRGRLPPYDYWPQARKAPAPAESWSSSSASREAPFERHRGASARPSKRGRPAVVAPDSRSGGSREEDAAVVLVEGRGPAASRTVSPLGRIVDEVIDEVDGEVEVGRARPRIRRVLPARGRIHSLRVPAMSQGWQAACRARRILPDFAPENWAKRLPNERKGLRLKRESFGIDFRPKEIAEKAYASKDPRERGALEGKKEKRGGSTRRERRPESQIPAERSSRPQRKKIPPDGETPSAWKTRSPGVPVDDAQTSSNPLSPGAPKETVLPSSETRWTTYRPEERYPRIADRE
ncbi:hypothetical protein KM043_008851 [Ampulex compressa]|nr:hypothetical protein KM043_008851 [Ampulex compressa]